AQLPASHSGALWSFPGITGDVIALINENDIPINVRLANIVVTIPPHSGIYDILDNILHARAHGDVSIESYDHNEFYVLGLRFSSAGFMIIEPEAASDTAPETISNSSNDSNSCPVENCNDGGNSG